jgi:hypothetical protein
MLTLSVTICERKLAKGRSKFLPCAAVGMAYGTSTLTLVLTTVSSTKILKVGISLFSACSGLNTKTFGSRYLTVVECVYAPFKNVMPSWLGYQGAKTANPKIDITP